MTRAASIAHSAAFDLPQWLDRYTPFDDLETLQATQLRQFLAMSGNAYDRSNLVAHVVADPWIVNQTVDKVLLMNHAYKGVWITPGGHCDGDPDVVAAAQREACEETGLTDVRLYANTLFDISCGYVPYRQKPHGAEPLHLHFDVCFLFQANDTAPLSLCEEGTEWRWVPFVELEHLTMFEEHKRRVRKSLAYWGFPQVLR